MINHPPSDLSSSQGRSWCLIQTKANLLGYYNVFIFFANMSKYLLSDCRQHGRLSIFFFEFCAFAHLHNWFWAMISNNHAITLWILVTSIIHWPRFNYVASHGSKLSLSSFLNLSRHCELSVFERTRSR